MSNCKISSPGIQVEITIEAIHLFDVFVYNNFFFLFGYHDQLQGSSLETFFIIGKVSSEAVIEAKMLKSKSLLTWLNVKLDKILLEVRLWGMQVALWLLQLRKALSWSNQPF